MATTHLQPIKRAIRRLGKNNVERARRFGWHPRTLYRFQSGRFDKIVQGLIKNPDVLLELALYAQRISQAADRRSSAPEPSPPANLTEGMLSDVAAPESASVAGEGGSKTTKTLDSHP